MSTSPLHRLARCFDRPRYLARLLDVACRILTRRGHGAFARALRAFSGDDLFRIVSVFSGSAYQSLYGDSPDDAFLAYYADGLALLLAAHSEVARDELVQDLCGHLEAVWWVQDSTVEEERSSRPLFWPPFARFVAART